jgi:hypothetical protein
MGKDDGSAMSSMMNMMMMSQMFNNGNGANSNGFNPIMFMFMNNGGENPFMNMFDGAFNFGVPEIDDSSEETKEE